MILQKCVAFTKENAKLSGKTCDFSVRNSYQYHMNAMLGRTIFSPTHKNSKNTKLFLLEINHLTEIDQNRLSSQLFFSPYKISQSKETMILENFSQYTRTSNMQFTINEENLGLVRFVRFQAFPAKCVADIDRKNN